MNETKKHILTTSLVLFLQKSYRDVTMSEIVKKTGLSKGAFYHYFTSKEELFKEIVTMFFEMGKVDYAVFSKKSLRKFYHQYVDFLDKSLTEMNSMTAGTDTKTQNYNSFLILFEAAARFPELLTAELEIHKRDMAAWKKIIATARQKGEIKTKSSDEEIAELFLFCNDGAFIRYINNDSKKTYKEYLLSAYETLYNNLKT